MTSIPDSPNHDLEEYKQLTDLFKFYLGLAVTTLNYTFLITGGVTAYILTGTSRNPNVSAIGLLVPTFICLAIGLGFVRAIPSANELTQAMEVLKIRLNLVLPPHTENLTRTLQWAGVFLIVMSGSLFLLFILFELEVLTMSAPTSVRNVP